MEHLATIVALIGEVGVLLGVVVPVIISVRKIKNGMKCQLRSDMLQIYYHNREKKKIHQYEYENFFCLFEAYSELRGNSFITKIAKEVQEWEVVA